MNEITLRKLNPTETISKSLSTITEAFVTFYGESERERITTKFQNMLVIGYNPPTSISSIINQSNREKSNELIEKFLNKLTTNQEEKEKLTSFLLDNNDLGYHRLQPIYSYITYLDGSNVSDYNKERVVEFLKQTNQETTLDNLDDFIKLGKFKNIDTIVPIYKQALAEYKAYEIEMKPYVDYVNKCYNIKDILNKKYKKQLALELKDLFTEEEFVEVEKTINNRFFSSIHSINSKTKNYTALSLDSKPLVESFSEENNEIMKTGAQWRKDSIIRDRIQYFKNFGLDLGDEYDNYLNDPRTKNLIPSQELIARIQNTHKDLYTKMMNEYYTTLPEYKNNRARIEELKLLNKEDGYNAHTYERGGTSIATNLKLVDGKYVEYPLFLLYMGGIEEYLDHVVIHELNHVYELTIKKANNNTCSFCCGWDMLEDTISKENQETVSLEDRKEKRNYELFNEIINELIAQEISEIISQSGQYIFNTKENKKITGGTSYERTKFIVKSFYETYKKEIIASRKNGDITILYDAVGKDNIEEFNELFHEFYDAFGTGMKFYQTYENLNKGIETDLTKKINEIISKRNEILGKMEEHYQNRSHSL